MKLTALEIKQQSFEKVLRGYDQTEVSSFLSLVANEWEHMTGKTRELEKEIERLNEKLKHYERVESALHETLQTAKDSAEHKLAAVRKESKSILEKAEMEADMVVREANQQRQQIRQSILRLLDRREEIVKSISSYLENAQQSLNQYAKDEASLFSLPKEESLDTTKSAKENKKSSDSDSDDEAAKGTYQNSPGVEKMDDILDELE